MSIELEKGIPVPEKAYAKSGLLQTLKVMEIGDSFVWPKAKRGGLPTYFRQIHNAKFTSRTIDNDSVRVWRTE